jgi:hypothetical protein
MNFTALKISENLLCKQEECKRIWGPCISYAKFQIYCEIFMPGNFQSKTQNEFDGKTVQLMVFKSFTFQFILSFQLKISRHENFTINFEFCIGNARAPNPFAFFPFAQYIFRNF